MFTFSVSDSFYRFNCTPDTSPIGDVSFVTKILILPNGDNEFCTQISEYAYKMLDKNLKKLAVYSPTNEIHFNDREIVEFDGNFYDDTAYIFFSDLSRGFNYNDACRLDSYTAMNIEDNKITDVTFEQFSAFEVLPALLRYASEKRYSFIRLGVANSAEFSTNAASTVGYGAWALYSGSKCEYIKQYYSDEISRFVRFNLRNSLHIACSECFNFPEVFNQEFKVFVTLEKDGYVCGVSGSYKTPEPLFKALVKRTFGAAFSDNRFAPVKPEDFDRLKISVTLLCDDIMDSVLIEV
ncbi:MAG: AMMECR1 domain-containing protein [Fusobacterium sp.]|nr:AMMECR1 domain-containing protein [Fusobacterium sp.]